MCVKSVQNKNRPLKMLRSISHAPTRCAEWQPNGRGKQNILWLPWAAVTA
jgi:hypothetical protein